MACHLTSHTDRILIAMLDKNIQHFLKVGPSILIKILIKHTYISNSKIPCTKCFEEYVVSSINLTGFAKGNNRLASWLEAIQ